jgi:bifunctional oligoribonuclease and PAP phosphatase NrnA
MTKQIKQTILTTFKDARQVLITSHQNPDGDSIGSQLALAEFLAALGLPNVIVNDGIIPSKYHSLPGINRILDIDDFAPSTGFDVAVVVECSNLARAGKVEHLVDPRCAIVNIDHHPDNASFGGINWIDVAASAAGEMIYELIRETDLTITSTMAANLYTAILTDTGRFHYSNTTARCLRIAAELIEAGADPTRLTNDIYFRQSREMIHLTALVAADMDYLLEGRLCAMTLDRARMRDTRANQGDAEGLINVTMSAAGVRVGVLFTELDDAHTKVSFRSQDAIDVGEIAAHYGGGGHVNASGCQVNLPLVQARREVLNYLKDRLNGSV